MKLMTVDNSELMQVDSVRVEGGQVIVSGTIMGAMPVQAVLSGTQMRRGCSLVGLGGLLKILRVFLAGKGA